MESIFQSQKAIKSFRHSLTLVNPCWLLQINSLSFIHAEMSLICNYLADRAKDKSLPSQIFLSLLEDGYEVFLFHVIMNLLLKNRIFQRPQRTAFKWSQLVSSIPLDRKHVVPWVWIKTIILKGLWHSPSPFQFCHLAHQFRGPEGRSSRWKSR